MNSIELQTHTLAFDFIIEDRDFKLVEISYCFGVDPYYNCPGYFDNNLVWHNSTAIPHYFIIEGLISQLKAEI